jgi:hypothetical protein
MTSIADLGFEISDWPESEKMQKAERIVVFVWKSEI